MTSSTTLETSTKHDTNLVPFRGRILVTPVDAETQTKGGIIIPDTARKIGDEYIVRAVGPGDFDEATGVQIPIEDLEVGQHIILNKYTGTEIIWMDSEGQDHAALVVKPSEVIAVFE